jgi:hypothetical protein
VTDAVGHWLNAAGRVPLLSAAEEVHLSQAIRRWQDWEGGPEGFLPKSRDRTNPVIYSICTLYCNSRWMWQ